MQLFKVPPGQRVRVTSKLIRWVEHQTEQRLAENVTWEGTVTDKRHYYKGAMRVLLINHTIDWPEFGVWQRDCECEIIENSAPYKPKPRQTLLIDD